jgi:hypothetical protein
MDKQLMKLGSGTVFSIIQVYGDAVRLVLNCSTDPMVNPYEFELPTSESEIAREAFDGRYHVEVWGSPNGITADRRLRLAPVETVKLRGQVVDLSLATNTIGIYSGDARVEDQRRVKGYVTQVISNMQEALAILAVDPGATVEIVRSIVQCQCCLANVSAFLNEIDQHIYKHKVKYAPYGAGL